jgi:hypothetical protein
MMRRFAATAVLAISLASCGEKPGAGDAPSTGPDVPRVVLHLPIAERSGFVDGGVSPDGRTFAYGVASGKQVRVWSVGLATERARVLTPGRGKRVDLAWSPDGSRLAYWDANRGGIWKLDPRSGRELRVKANPFWSYDFVSVPRWTLSGDLVFDHNEIESIPHVTTQWLIPAGGGKARPLPPTPPGMPEYPAPSPDGRRIAFFAGGCCGGGGVALWVLDASGENQRCVAGPVGATSTFPLWAPDGTELYFLHALPGEKQTQGAYVARAAGGSGARPLRRDSVLSLSMDARGDVYLVTGARGRGPRPLWRYPSRAVRAAAAEPAEIPGCPPPDSQVMRFVEETRLPDVRSVDELWKDPSRDLVLFRVTFGREMDWGVWETRAGLRVGGRIGWIAAEDDLERMVPRPTFDLRPDDDFLFSPDFLRRLRGTGFENDWFGLVAADPDTPPGYPGTPSPARPTAPPTRPK